jgi:anti-anti-sigma regulatory factor
MMAFSVDSKLNGDTLVLEVKGSVDEDSNFTPPNLGSASRVVLDLNHVTAINSVGIREWIKWVKTMPASLQLSVRNCPKIIVDQINMVAGFLPAGTVIESFYVPYYADSSGNEKMVLFTNGKEFKGSDLFAPDVVKGEGGEEMEMDVIEAKYFKFLKNG